MKALIVLVGSVVGVLLVGQFVLVGMEKYAWEIFWELLPEGGPFSFEEIFQSTTFWKCAGGAAAGGMFGWLAARVLGK